MRDAGGRFAAGTAPGPGRPAGWNEAFRRACTPEDLRRIIAAVVKKAKSGDLKAAELILRRTIPEAVADADASVIVAVDDERVDDAELGRIVRVAFERQAREV